MKPVRVALLGDGMTEKWGALCLELDTELRHLFKRTEFEIENHSVANTRAGYALYRVARDYKGNDGVYRPCLSYNNPDIVVIESFAYSNCTDDAEGLTEYRDILRRLWEELSSTTAAKLLFFITVPPDRDRFVENMSAYANTSKATRRRLADRAKLYLEEAQRIAQDEGWPVANAYAEVLKKVEGGDRLARYINQSDNMHPSVYGFETVARILARAVDTHRMVEEGAIH